ncbi:hypothetical protein QTN25_005932 [Entamoeba marina]
MNTNLKHIIQSELFSTTLLKIQLQLIQRGVPYSTIIIAFRDMNLVPITIDTSHEQVFEEIKQSNDSETRLKCSDNTEEKQEKKRVCKHESSETEEDGTTIKKENKYQRKKSHIHNVKENFV